MSRFVVPEGTTDPVLIRRVQIYNAVKLAKRVGYSLFLAAIVAFVVTKIDKPTNLATSIVTWSMAIGSILLAPAIVFGYAVNAAAREDRQRAATKAAKAAKLAQADKLDKSDRAETLLQAAETELSTANIDEP
jgi:hypothetical protein